MTPPVLIIHGTFSTGALMEPWARFFEEAGYQCHTPDLPGREPTDREALSRLRFDDYVERILEYRAGLTEPPIVIGHSMGGLVAQRLAAETECAALVLLASVPPGVLWAQPRAVPHLLRLLPGILAGRPILPSRQTLRSIVFNDLADAEADELAPRLVPDSGRAFRSLVFGTVRVPGDAIRCPVLCVSGGADRNVAGQISRAIAKRYGAEHQVHAECGHWIVAPSRVSQVAPPVLAWLNRLPTPSLPEERIST